MELIILAQTADEDAGIFDEDEMEEQRKLMAMFEKNKSSSEKEKEEAAAKALRDYLSIDSRRELRDNEDAKEDFGELCKRFRVFQLEGEPEDTTYEF